MDYKTFIIYYLVIINILGFLIFALDKHRARTHQWRIKESFLFFLALVGGGIGCLLSMLLFRHKTRHTSFRMGIPTIMMVQILAVFCLYTLTGCQKKEPEPVAVVKEELDQIKETDKKTVTNSLENVELFPGYPTSDNADSDTMEVFTLFFQDFDYTIDDYTIDEEKGTATVNVTLTTINAKDLAKDFLAQSIVKQIQGSAAPSAVTYNTNDYYHSLHKLLRENKYDTISTSYSFDLSRPNDKWVLGETKDLDTLLSGDFATHVANTELFTPEEMVALYLDTIKGFDKEQMNQFLALDDLFAADDEYKRTISKALAAQILTYLDYKILDCTSDGVTATVKTEITSCDCVGIIDEYTKKVNEYTQTSQALEDGVSGRLNHTNKLLVECINNNKKSSSSVLTMTLVNNGANWELKFDEALAQAILGNISAAAQKVADSLGSTEITAPDTATNEAATDAETTIVGETVQ